MQLTPLLVGKWRIVKSAIHDTRERESALMNNLTPRGWLVLVILPALALLAALVWISGHVWYVPTPYGGRYCIGTMAECFKDSFH
jgi:hypothetical protein